MNIPRALTHNRNNRGACGPFSYRDKFPFNDFNLFYFRHFQVQPTHRIPRDYMPTASLRSLKGQIETQPRHSRYPTIIEIHPNDTIPVGNN